MVTITSKLSLAGQDMEAYAGVYNNIFLVAEEDVRELLEREKNPSRILFSINGKGNIPRALMPDGTGGYFILVNKELCRKYELEPDQEVTLRIQPDDSEYGMPLPEELAELWAMDPDAHRVFHSLTPGKQRGLIYQVSKPKGAETRIKKAVQISEYLKSVDGTLDYKELNEYIKADNAHW